VTAEASASCCASDANTGASESESVVCTTTVKGSVDVTRASMVPSVSSASPAAWSATSCVFTVAPVTVPVATICSDTSAASGVTPTCCVVSDFEPTRLISTPPSTTAATSAMVVQMKAFDRMRLLISRPAIRRTAAPEDSSTSVGRGFMRTPLRSR
jgi:hypothetical protein